MKWQEIMQNLDQGQHHPVYMVHGSEYYLSRQFFDRLTSTLADPDSLDSMTLDFQEVGMSVVLDEANTFSFFSDTRVIIVEKADFITSQSGTKLDKHDEEALLDYIASPNTATILVFVCQEDGLDKRRKIVKALQKQAVWVDVMPMDQAAVEQFVANQLQYHQVDMNRQAFRELLERVNYQLTLAMGEMTKLQTFQQSGQALTREIIQQLVPRTLESDVFKLSNAVVNKQIDQAIQIYQDLILMKHEPIALHALLVSQFRIFIQVRIMMEQGVNQPTIATHLGVHPYRIKLASQNARGLTLEELLSFYQELVQVDFQMKTGIGLKESYFYILLTKLMA